MTSRTVRTSTHLPVIDLGGLPDDEDAETVIGQRIDDVFRNFGFCYFSHTGIDPTLVSAVFNASRRFHALPMSSKLAIAMNSFHRGYMESKSSLLETSSVARVTQPNDSESFMLMHEVLPEDPRYGTEVNGPNLWPADLPGFREPVQAYDRAMREFCMRLLRPIARALGMPPDTFQRHFRQPTTFLRLLHYPPQASSAPDDAYGSAPHTDFGFITILAQDDVGGLEVRPRGGDWIAAPPLPGTFVVNVADMLAGWTNDRWQSTPHRVKNLSGVDRYSCPWFFDMDLDCLVTCLDSCHGPADPPRYAPVRYGDYLMERLNRNYRYRRQTAAPMPSPSAA
jgi:isopenicillin N synthase-like dioxygenase